MPWRLRLNGRNGGTASNLRKYQCPVRRSLTALDSGRAAILIACSKGVSCGPVSIPFVEEDTSAKQEFGCENFRTSYRVSGHGNDCHPALRGAGRGHGKG